MTYLNKGQPTKCTSPLITTDFLGTANKQLPSCADKGLKPRRGMSYSVAHIRHSVRSSCRSRSVYQRDSEDCAAAHRKLMRLPSKKSGKYILVTITHGSPWLIRCSCSLRLLGGSVRNEDRSLQCVGLWYISSYSDTTSQGDSGSSYPRMSTTGQYISSIPKCCAILCGCVQADTIG